MWLYLLQHATGAIPVANSYFGRGTGALLLDYVSCTGHEQFLATCSNNGVGITSSSCNHYNDAGVQCPGKIKMSRKWQHIGVAIMLCVANHFTTDPVNATTPCTNGDIRLAGGLSSNQGRVEICYNNQWGTVCDNSFTNIDARVVCRQLGFPALGEQEQIHV